MVKLPPPTSHLPKTAPSKADLHILAVKLLNHGEIIEIHQYLATFTLHI